MIQNLYSRNTGSSISANRIKQLTGDKVDALFTESDLALAVKANLSVMRSLETEIAILERVVKERIKLKPAYRYLLSVSGIGQTLALTTMLETGDIRRFAKVGNFVSYCRCVKSTKLSNGKRKGSGNTKNGNKYLSWAFVEAANFAIRFEPLVARFYQGKEAKTHRVLALRAVANKRARVTTSCATKCRLMSIGPSPRKSFSVGMGAHGGSELTKGVGLEPKVSDQRLPHPFIHRQLGGVVIRTP